MKQLLSKLVTFLKSLFTKSKPAPKPVPKLTIRHIFGKLQSMTDELDEIGFWFSTNPSQTTSEMADQFDKAQSRMLALTSAVLIAVRQQEELKQIQRMAERAKK